MSAATDLRWRKIRAGLYRSSDQQWEIRGVTATAHGPIVEWWRYSIPVPWALTVWSNLDDARRLA